ncbi:MAG: response regulator [Desulfobacterales bacterium]|nr:MAG: response regulator [Desulfobacterales bacterium]
MKRHHILIVDDEVKNIRLLKAMLTPGDYLISEAVNGEDALQAVAQVRPDLILLDIMMPGIDGFEVCRRLKQDDQTKMIPIVMVTALREKEHRVSAMELGADDFLSKPVDRTELLVRVKSLLRIKRYHDELFESYQEITEKNKKLQELEKIKEGLMHMIIHDLRNPLTAISGNIELMLVDKKSFSEAQRKKLTNSLGFCQDLNEMIQSLLDIHKMENEKLALHKKRANPVDLVAEVLEQFIPKAEMHQVALSFHESPDGISIEVDCGLIKRVIANLVSNAIRHTPAGGKVEVAAEAFRDQGNLSFSVKDTGNGVASEYLLKVFDKFEQVGLKQAKIRVGSSGLGLAFCRLAVEAHGGRIWVESEGEGKGSNFRFTLPLWP